MPRRKDPFDWRKPEIFEVSSVPFPEEAKSTVLELLGSDAKSKDALSKKLDALTTYYTSRRAQEVSRPTRAQSSERLRQLATAAMRFDATGDPGDRTTVGEMLSLDLRDHADWLFRQHLSDLHRQEGLNGEEAVELSESVLDRPDLIAEAARRACVQLSAQRGPDRNNTLYLTARYLVDLWETATGETATHGRGNGRHYSHRATSAAGIFITAFIEVVDSALPASRPAEALRHVLAVRP
jgi:hypothetical protein